MSIIKKFYAVGTGKNSVKLLKKKKKAGKKLQKFGVAVKKRNSKISVLDNEYAYPSAQTSRISKKKETFFFMTLL